MFCRSYSFRLAPYIGGRGTDTLYVKHDIYAVPVALDEAEAQAMISLIRNRLPVHVAEGVEEF